MNNKSDLEFDYSIPKTKKKGKLRPDLEFDYALPQNQKKTDKSIQKPNDILEMILGTPSNILGQYGKKELGNVAKYAASIGNAPTAAYEYFGGEPLYKHFEPFYKEPEAQNLYSQLGSKLPSTTEFASLLPAFKAASMVPKAAEGASLIAKALSTSGKLGASGSAGYATGLAIGGDERQHEAQKLGLDALIGQTLGGIIGGGINRLPSRKIGRAENALEQAETADALQKNAIAKAKAQASESTGLSNVERFSPRIDTLNDKITSALDTLELLPKEQFNDFLLHESHTQLPKLAKVNLDNINKEISKSMGAGKHNDRPLADNIIEHFEGVEIPGSNKRQGGLAGEIGSMYNNVRSGFEGKTIHLENPLNHSDIERMARADLEKAGVTNPSEFVLNKFISSNYKYDKSIDAQKYFDNYQSLKQEINREWSSYNARKHSLTNNEKRAEKFRIANMQDDANQMESLFSEQLQESPELLKLFKEANHRWATEYAPLHSNTIYRQMMKEGTIDSKNLMDDLRGKGHDKIILRNYLQSNPEAAEMLANYHYADHPMALQEIPDYQREYINPQLTPNIMRYIEEQNQGIHNIERAEYQKSEFDEIMKNVKEQKKEHELKLKEREQLETNIPKWKKEIEELEKHEQLIRHELDKKQFTEKEAKNKQKELKILESKRNKLRSKLGYIGKGAIILELLRRHDESRNQSDPHQ